MACILNNQDTIEISRDEDGLLLTKTDSNGDSESIFINYQYIYNFLILLNFEVERKLKK